jgi:predicted AAA+ superfamily ATPase
MVFCDRKHVEEAIDEIRRSYPIVLLTGLHGVGKSTLLAHIAKRVRESRPPVRILQLDARDGLREGRDLAEAARALGVGPSALILDNADIVRDLGTALTAIRARHTVSIVLAGASSQGAEKACESAFGPSGTGVYASYTVHPLEYGEFLLATGLSDSRTSLDAYSKVGGLPQSLMVPPTSPDALAFALLRANSFLLTEIVEPASIRNPAYLRALLSIVARSGGERLSARQAAEAMDGLGITISSQAVLDYLALCSEARLLIPVPILDIAEKRPLDSAGSWYYGDAGLRYAFAAREARSETSKAEENLAFLKLISDGWKVSRGRVGYGKLAREEITFVCDKAGKRLYVQCLPASAGRGERARMIEALLAVRDAWPRVLIGEDESTGEGDGIARTFMREFLLKGPTAVA